MWYAALDTVITLFTMPIGKDQSSLHYCEMDKSINSHLQYCHRLC